MNRNTALSVVALAVLSMLALNFSGAATTTSTAPARHYYLTQGTFNGDHALKACASGYHFAAAAELSDSSVITYNKTLGRSQADDGAGPPTVAFGWVRSGYVTNSSPTNSAGQTNVPTNCNLWTSAAGSDDGEMGGFGPGTTGIEAVDFAACDNSQGYSIGVWCVEN
jgi:hypothetical protein